MAILQQETVSEKPNWDEINRGKVRCVLVEALLSNPNVVTDIENVNAVAIQKLADAMLAYVFGDK